MSLEEIKKFIPKLTSNLHKGSLGRICVIGGCKDYTGAPYFAGMSALRCGSDLVHIMTTESASIPIKCYSPDLMVHSYLPELEGKTTLLEGERLPENVLELLKKINCLCIGPGLGRSKRTQEFLYLIIKQARSIQLPICIDADGLWAVKNNLECIQGYRNVILTPNHPEFIRLYQSAFACDPNMENLEQTVKELSNKLGNVTILKKGSIDFISNGVISLQGQIQGSNRRVSGQGDILSGCATVFLNWALKSVQQDNKETIKSLNKEELENSKLNGFISNLIPLAALGASAITRRANLLAYKKIGRSIITSDILTYVGKSFDELFLD
ncbi:atp-dependent (s)-nad(p)h-hydrate dehydratase family member [Anaeramoeba flamelloides]|uniref:ATP-dependent (S)-NAD(P)H-hydrate dehydratase n=1 Tax=Anaeramoeba flamelloides TaxID=1746091 RepID=A0AAV7YVU2_9EUKA|nr:atp-dependent (s)-nad(p)h-hydrate dehydratase family member [Anaeramoeba flamelloides]|eukprot:Anaeramoba_flamelloidesa1055147_82.p1 GENE.a1055147_82~~a1055147_82.p1  ORF type:complete len:326 (-),score=48.03 a1055147_82:126-1103(-)